MTSKFRCRLADKLLRLSSKLDTVHYPWYCAALDTLAGWLRT